MKTLLGITMIALLAAAVFAQEHASKENQVRDRGQTPVQDNRQTLDRGRVFKQDAMPLEPLVLRGILVDAGCRDRSQLNLSQPPVPIEQTLPAETSGQANSQKSERSKQGYATGKTEPQSGNVSAHGISVDAQTLQGEREDVLEHQVPDLLNREEDPSCAITGRTTAFGLLLTNGRLLDLDEGGNTWALQMVQSSNPGSAMLNGKGSALKPKVTVKGRVRGDRVIVDSLNLG